VTLRATGPGTDNVNQPNRAGTLGTRPGMCGCRLHCKSWRLRNEPPMSLPSARGTIHKPSRQPRRRCCRRTFWSCHKDYALAQNALKVGNPGKFRHIRLANDNPAGIFLPWTTRQSKSGMKSFRTSERKWFEAFRFVKVLNANRKAVQGTEPIPFCQRFVCRRACAINSSSGTKVTTR